LSWISELKIAIINSELDKIVELYESMPDFDDTEEMQEASALIKQAIESLQTECDTLEKSMNRYKVAKKYGQGTMGHPYLDKKS